MALTMASPPKACGGWGDFTAFRMSIHTQVSALTLLRLDSVTLTYSGIRVLVLHLRIHPRHSQAIEKTLSPAEPCGLTSRTPCKLKRETHQFKANLGKIERLYLKKQKQEPGVVAHVFSLSTPEAEASKFL